MPDRAQRDECWSDRMLAGGGPPSAKSIRRALAANFRAARAYQRLTHEQVAARMRVLGYSWHAQTVSQVEAGKRRLGAEEMIGLSAAMETSVDILRRLPYEPGPV